MKYTDLQGVIFDVDDTLLNNFSHDPERALHGRARLLAAHEAGARFNIPALLQVTSLQSVDCFRTAPQHTLESAVWNLMGMCGIVEGDTPDPANEVFRAIIDRKSALQDKLLREEGEEIPGAVAFVRALAEQGLRGKLAIASTASRVEIDIFFEKVGLNEFFPHKHIISKETVTNHKPHPEAFDEAFKTLGLPDSARPLVAAFEDNPRGIASAKAAGLTVFAITTVWSREALAALDVPPDVIADSYAEFTDLLGLPSLA